MSAYDDMFDSYEDEEEPEDQRINFSSIKHTTIKAILFSVQGGEVWLPKRETIIDGNVAIVPHWVTVTIMKPKVKISKQANDFGFDSE